MQSGHSSLLRTSRLSEMVGEVHIFSDRPQAQRRHVQACLWRAACRQFQQNPCLPLDAASEVRTSVSECDDAGLRL